MEELECAKKNGKFIQTTCMFVHQYRVQRFLNHVLQDDNFGRITEVDASIQLNCDDVEKVGVKLPLRKEDGCIRVLGRFCVLVSTMFFNRVGSYAESAKVNSCRCGSNGEIVSADCTVNFTNVSMYCTCRVISLNRKILPTYCFLIDFASDFLLKIFFRFKGSKVEFLRCVYTKCNEASNRTQGNITLRNYERLCHRASRRSRHIPSIRQGSSLPGKHECSAL